MELTEISILDFLNTHHQNWSLKRLGKIFSATKEDIRQILDLLAKEGKIFASGDVGSKVSGRYWSSIPFRKEYRNKLNEDQRLKKANKGPRVTVDLPKRPTVFDRRPLGPLPAHIASRLNPTYKYIGVFDNPDKLREQIKTPKTSTLWAELIEE